MLKQDLIDELTDATIVIGEAVASTINPDFYLNVDHTFQITDVNAFLKASHITDDDIARFKSDLEAFDQYREKVTLTHDNLAEMGVELIDSEEEMD